MTCSEYIEMLQEQLLKGMKLNQKLANASLVRHKNALQQQYGAMGSAVLAEAVSGRPWGLPKVPDFVYAFLCVNVCARVCACCWFATSRQHFFLCWVFV